jgi:hypothetical protein
MSDKKGEPSLVESAYLWSIRILLHLFVLIVHLALFGAGYVFSERGGGISIGVKALPKPMFVWIAKGCLWPIYLDTGLVLVLASEALWSAYRCSWLPMPREKPLSVWYKIRVFVTDINRFLDHRLLLHRIASIYLLFFSLLHALAHFMNIATIWVRGSVDLLWILKHGTMLTGIVLMLILIAQTILAAKKVRGVLKYEIFAYSHVVLALFYCSLLLVHGSFCFLPKLIDLSVVLYVGSDGDLLDI